MDWEQHIHSDPAILLGKPVVRGTRLAVEFLLDLMSAGWSRDDILHNYPQLTEESLAAVRRFALGNR
ncbi:MAG: DUF433 domain-containing protein [Armatimonadetes bacterium]|nr:DUF433 domain-containing protein [Armatimonadota bacterium]